jgi:hypothetical protein
MTKLYKYLMSKGKAHYKITLLFLLLSLFIVGILFGILIGKYEVFPYNVLQKIRAVVKANYDISMFEYMESFSQKKQKDKMKIILAQRNIKQNAKIIEPVLNKILPIIYSSEKITPDYNVNLPKIIGYTKNFSVIEGDSLPFYIHNEVKVKVDLYWLGRKKTYIKNIGTVEPFKQSAMFSPIKGFEWMPSLNLSSKNLKPGYYLLEFGNKEHSALFQIPFVVTSKKVNSISFVSSTNTWNAYNNYPRKSFYADTETIDEVKEFNEGLNSLLEYINAPKLPIHIPFERPYTQPEIVDERPEEPHYSHLLRGEWSLLAFAEEHNLKYGVYTDREVNNNSTLFDSDIVVFNSHTEYWTKDMVEALKAYILKGGKVVFAGGNSIFGDVQYNEFGIELIQMNLAKDISPIIGTFFSQIASPMFASYKVKNMNHWIFEGTNIKNGDEFANISLNHRHEEKNNGASGWEADQISKYSKGFTVLARGTNRFGAADMVFKDTGNGGWVFNASSIPFTGALFVDSVVAKIMLNLLTYK